MNSKGIHKLTLKNNAHDLQTAFQHSFTDLHMSQTLALS